MESATLTRPRALPAALALPFGVKESTAEVTPKMDWLGVLPLAVSTGAGANARHAIGTGVIGGMIRSLPCTARYRLAAQAGALASCIARITTRMESMDLRKPSAAFVAASWSALGLGMGAFVLELVSVNGQPGRVLRGPEGPAIWDVLAIDVVDGRIAAVRIVRNPDKLAHMVEGAGTAH